MAAVTFRIASAPSPLPATGASSVASSTRGPCSSSGGLSSSSFRLSGGLGVHVDRFTVLRGGRRKVPAGDVVEGTLPGGVVLARACSAGVRSHGICGAVESVGPLPEEVDPFGVSISNQSRRRGVDVEQGYIRAFLCDVEGHNVETGDDIVEYGFGGGIVAREVVVVVEESFEFVIFEIEEGLLDSD